MIRNGNWHPIRGDCKSGLYHNPGLAFGGSLENLWETSLVVQWLLLRASTVGGRGSIPARETKIPHAIQHAKKKFCFLKRRGYEGRETSWKAIKIVPLSPGCLQKKPCFFPRICDEGRSHRCSESKTPHSSNHPLMQLVLTNASYVPCHLQDTKDIKLDLCGPHP